MWYIVQENWPFLFKRSILKKNLFSLKGTKKILQSNRMPKTLLNPGFFKENYKTYFGDN